MNEAYCRARFIVATAFIVLIMAGLTVRLAFLHLGGVQKSRFEQLRTFSLDLSGERGRIVDRRGDQNILACDYVMSHIWVDPSKIQEEGREQEVVDALSRHLDVDTNDVLKRVHKQNRKFEYIKKFVSPDLALKVHELKLPGVYSSEIKVRHYPHDAFMCHVLGFSNYEGYGSAGIELKMDKYLRGSPGYVQSMKDGQRRELYHKREQYIEPRNGANVSLTIDQYIQDMTEIALDDVMKEHNAEGAWAIVQDVYTGEILAMASRPAYNLNQFRYATDNQKLNRAIGYTYEPGSTLKVIPLAAVLNEGLVSPRTMIDCEGGTWFYAGRPLRDYHPYGMLSLADVLKKSSNIGTAKMAIMLGEARFESYMKEFGIGEKLNVGLPGEERGIFHDRKKWSKLSISRLPIGQGVSTTALQVLGSFCAIANGGNLMRPYVISEVRDNTGAVMMREEPQVIGQPISEETAETMRYMLARVTRKGGTGRRAAIEGYTVAGKTGTAQKAIRGGYSDTDHVASFVGFIPAIKPRIGIIVAVDNPQPIHTGGRVAAPVFKAIAENAVRYLDIAPDMKPEELPDRFATN